MQDEIPEVTAYHEAGHAFVAVFLGARVRTITLEPHWDDGPARYADVQVELSRNGLSDKEVREKSILIALSGPVAEMIYRGEPYHPGLVPEWAADWKLAWSDAGKILLDERKRLRFLEQVTVELYRLLERDQHWAAVAALADNLLAHETLEEEAVMDILDAWMP